MSVYESNRSAVIRLDKEIAELKERIETNQIDRINQHILIEGVLREFIKCVRQSAKLWDTRELLAKLDGSRKKESNIWTKEYWKDLGDEKSKEPEPMTDLEVEKNLNITYSKEPEPNIWPDIDYGELPQHQDLIIVKREDLQFLIKGYDFTTIQRKLNYGRYKRIKEEYNIE